MSKTQQVDAIDRSILLALDHSPRASSVEIASLTGLSRNTVQSRLKRLEQSEVLGAPSHRIRPHAIGYPVLAFITIELVQGSPRTIADSLRDVPELLDVYAVSGDGDLLARVAARDTSDLYRITQRLLRAPGVVRTRSTIAVHELIPTRMGPLLRALGGPDGN